MASARPAAPVSQNPYLKSFNFSVIAKPVHRLVVAISSTIHIDTYAILLIENIGG